MLLVIASQLLFSPVLCDLDVMLWPVNWNLGHANECWQMKRK